MSSRSTLCLVALLASTIASVCATTPIAGPTVTVNHYLQDCTTFRNASVFSNTPNACNPIYDADGSVNAYAKFTTACSMPANFFELTVHTSSDSSCTGSGTLFVVALSTVGCNRDRNDHSAFTVSCTGGSATPSSAFIFAQHGDNSCNNLASTSVVPNQVGCVPIYDVNATVTNYIQNDALCGSGDHFHLVKFYNNSACSGSHQQLLEMWVNDVGSCNPGSGGSAQNGTSVTCYGVAGMTAGQDQILVLQGNGSCSNFTSTMVFSNTIGCNALYQSDIGDIGGYIQLDAVAGTSDKFVNATLFTDSACTIGPKPVLVATGPSRCNYESQWQSGVRVVQSTEVLVFSSIASGTSNQAYFYVQNGDENCAAVHESIIFANLPGVCVPMMTGGTNLTGYARATNSCSENALGFQTIDVTGDTDPTCASSPVTYVVATGSGSDICNVAPMSGGGPGEGGTRVQCFGTAGNPPNSIFIEHYVDDCHDHQFTAVADNEAGLCVPMTMINGSVDLYLRLPQMCHPNHEFIEMTIHSLWNCSDTGIPTVMALAGTNNRCNVANGRGLRIRCTNDVPGTYTALPYVFIEHFIDSMCSASIFSTAIFNNTNQCTLLYPALLSASSTVYVRMANPCSPTTTFSEVDIFLDSACSAPNQVGHYIVQTSAGSCTVESLGRSMNFQCFGRPDVGAGPSAFIVMKSGSPSLGPSCSSFDGAISVANVGTCTIAYNEGGIGVGSGRVIPSASICSSNDLFVTIDKYPTLDCTGPSNRTVLSTQGVCNAGSNSHVTVQCYGSTAAASTTPFVRVETTKMANTCGSAFTQSAIVSNAPGTCNPVYIGNTDAISSWVILDTVCADTDDFISLTVYNTSNCGGTGQRQLLRAGSTHCNLGPYTGALRAMCYAPGVVKHDQSYVFVTMGQDCTTPTSTFAFNNVAAGCSLMMGVDNSSPGSHPSYVKFDHVCSANDKFHSVTTFNDSSCTQLQRHFVVRVGANQCNILNHSSTIAECFAPAGTASVENDFIFSENYDITCTNRSVTAIIPNIADACVPVSLDDGSITAYVKFSTPCTMGSTAFQTSVYSDSSCATVPLASSVIPDGATCNPTGMGASHVSCFGGYTAPPGYTPGAPITNPMFLPPPSAPVSTSSSSQAHFSIPLLLLATLLSFAIAEFVL